MAGAALTGAALAQQAIVRELMEQNAALSQRAIQHATAAAMASAALEASSAALEASHTEVASLRARVLFLESQIEERARRELNGAGAEPAEAAARAG